MKAKALSISRLRRAPQLAPEGDSESSNAVLNSKKSSTNYASEHELRGNSCSDPSPAFSSKQTDPRNPPDRSPAQPAHRRQPQIQRQLCRSRREIAWRRGILHGLQPL